MKSKYLKYKQKYLMLKMQFGGSKLHDEVGKGNLDAVDKLLKEKEVDINEKDKDGNTPLMVAANKYIADKSLNSKDICYMLLRSKADRDIQNKKGDNILHITVRSKNMYIFNIISERDMTVLTKQKNNEGKTPINIADGHEDINMLRSLNVFRDESDPKKRPMQILLLNEKYAFVDDKDNRNELIEQEIKRQAEITKSYENKE